MRHKKSRKTPPPEEFPFLNSSEMHLGETVVFPFPTIEFPFKPPKGMLLAAPGAYAPGGPLAKTLEALSLAITNLCAYINAPPATFTEEYRQAKTGEWIRVVAAVSSGGAYENGEVYQVIHDTYPDGNQAGTWIHCTKGHSNSDTYPDSGSYLCPPEYVVLVPKAEPAPQPAPSCVYDLEQRHAKVGEWVKIVDARNTDGSYDNGDILQVVYDTGSYGPGTWAIPTHGRRGKAELHPGCCALFWDEYLVLVFKPEDAPPAPWTCTQKKGQAKAGDWILVVAASDADGAYENGDVLQVFSDGVSYGENDPGVWTRPQPGKPGNSTTHPGAGYLLQKEYVVLVPCPQGAPPANYTEEHRPAKTGEWVKIVASDHFLNAYANGDILQVAHDTSPDGDEVGTWVKMPKGCRCTSSTYSDTCYLLPFEYVVLVPKKDPTPMNDVWIEIVHSSDYRWKPGQFFKAIFHLPDDSVYIEHPRGDACLLGYSHLALLKRGEYCIFSMSARNTAW